VEWFDKVDKFTVLDPQDYIGQSSGDTLRRKVIQELADVLNFGVGLQVYLSEKFSGYGSLATDFSALGTEAANCMSRQKRPMPPLQMGSLSPAGGAVFKIARAELAAGVAYAFEARTSQGGRFTR
jgi:hypothetical protein